MAPAPAPSPSSSLTPSQASAYLSRVQLPPKYQGWLREGPQGDHALDAVTALQRHHLIHIPFENLGLHYSSTHSLPQDTEHVYENVVTKSRGGTCAQIHQMFVKLLRSFGFVAYNTGGRINAAASLLRDPNLEAGKVVYGQWVHLASIVQIGHRKYIVDTNNGPRGSPTPVPLVEGEVHVDFLPSRERRCVYDYIPGWSGSSKWWRMQFRDCPQDPWLDVYCFTDTEWLPGDFEIIRTAHEKLDLGWVAPRVVCFRVLFDEEEEEEKAVVAAAATGYVMIWEDELRRNYKGKTETVQRFFSEEERTACIAEEFGIYLDEEEKGQIRGLGQEIVRDDEFDFYG